MSDRYRVEIDRPGNGERRVRLSGDVDLAAAEDIWKAIEPALEGASRVVVDLSGVQFIDSTGLSVLVRAHRRLMHDGGGLVVHRPSEPAARVLEVTGLDRLFGSEPA